AARGRGGGWGGGGGGEGGAGGGGGGGGARAVSRGAGHRPVRVGPGLRRRRRGSSTRPTRVVLVIFLGRRWFTPSGAVMKRFKFVLILIVAVIVVVFAAAYVTVRVAFPPERIGEIVRTQGTAIRGREVGVGS